MPYIAPYLPPIARVEVQQHEAGKKLCVHRIVESHGDESCKNCAGEGIVYLSFLGAGPTRLPLPGTRPSTFVPASEKNGEGWFIIEKTSGYPCPHCQGVRQPQSHRLSQTPA